MDTLAVVLEAPESLSLRRLALTAPGDEDVVVDIDWSGISTGTEKLLWTGRMPPFPGLGYPLVPGYESVGRVIAAGERSGRAVGDYVFVPGAKCYGEVHGLFGGAAARVVVPGARVIPFSEQLGEQGVLLALAATAYHALVGGELPELIVGHGVLGRLLARLAVVEGGKPVVWERNPQRMQGAEGYAVIDPATDTRKDYRVICDVSGDPSLLDTLIGRLARGGEVVLAGFYDKPLSFNFPPAFMREARLRVAAEFRDPDLAAVKAHVESSRLSLAGLITHRLAAAEAQAAYRTAFGDAGCLKMVLDWRNSR
ncbi:chlorophyll synthesis pathway protein BchC [Rhodocyclus tenuis]|uniref:3-hydroxyethyl bacteriochlorophyllide a dehydrogenase n=1 Tax=Rhodocyclus tenuis TaxID=1066 RepID=A0A840G5A9_RHOTE|nr:chlorophyll synthesis pathway protein BchC [Rhodocyclus tenuis]MBB4246180.1 3-hydroxyethyl bacteriochlorophyllide a dehydrogenase [Rhodocyclus tenuis]